MMKSKAYSFLIFCLFSSLVVLGRGRSAGDEVPKLEKLEHSFSVNAYPAPAFSHSGKLFAAKPQGGTGLQVFHVDTGEVIEVKTPEPSAIAICPDDSLIACSYRQGPSLRVFDAKTGEPKWEWQVKGRNGSAIHKLEFSRDGSKLLASGDVHVWDVATGSRIGPATSFTYPQLTFLNDDGTQLIGSESGFEERENLRYSIQIPVIFDAVSGEKLLELAAPKSEKFFAGVPWNWKKVAGKPLLAAKLTCSSNVASTSAIGLWSTETGKFQEVLHQGTLGLASAADFTFAGNQRFVVFHDSLYGLQAVATSDPEQQISLPFELSGTLPMGVSAEAERMAVATFDGSAYDVSFYAAPDFGDAEQMNDIQEALAALEREPPVLPEDLVAADKEPAADAGAIKDQNDAGAIVAKPLAAEAPTLPSDQEPMPPELREGWLLNSLGTEPFAAVGRIVGGEFRMCYAAEVPVLTEVDGMPIWSGQRLKLKSRFLRTDIRVFRGSGQAVPELEAIKLLGEEQFIFVLPSSFGEAEWVSQLKPEAIVVSFQPEAMVCQTPSIAAPSCAPAPGQCGGPGIIEAYAQLDGVCEDLHFKPHDNLKLSPIYTSRPTLSSTATANKMETRTRTYTVTKTRLETRTREVQKVVDGVPRTATETYTVGVPYTENVEQTYTVCVPFLTQRFAEKPSILATRFQANGKLVSLRCYRANGQRIHPLVFLAYASRSGSFLELQPGEKLLPEMVTKNIRDLAVVAKFFPEDAAKPIADDATVREELVQFEAFLDAGEVDKARDTLYVLPIVEPLWSEQFYELAYHQQQAGKTAAASESVLAGVVLEWERPVEGLSDAFKKEHSDENSEWVLSTRERMREQLTLRPIEQMPDFAAAPQAVGARVSPAAAADAAVPTAPVPGVAVPAADASAPVPVPVVDEPPTGPAK